MQKNHLVNLLHTLHYAVRLPVHWLHGEQAELSLPAGAQWVSRLLGKEGPGLFHELALDRVAGDAVYYVSSEYEEQFIGIRLGPDHILCGPYAMDTMNRQDFSRLVRSLRLRLDRRGALEAHYEGLVRLSQMNAHYVAALLEQLADDLRPDGGNKAYPLLHEPLQPPGRDAPANRLSGFRHPPLYFENEITRHIALGNLQEALRLLYELNTMKKARLADSPMRSLQNSLICAITLYTRAAIAGGVPSEEAFPISDSCIQLTERQQSAVSLLALEEAVVTRFTQAVAERRSRQYSQLVRSALSIIEADLTEPLSSKVLAERLFVHPDYLAARFRKETGETLHRHILFRRVSEAAHFMRYSEDSILSIAEFYRFSSQSHFSAVFKRFLGVTPQQYRAR